MGRLRPSWQNCMALPGEKGGIEDKRGEKYRQFRLLSKGEYKSVVNIRSLYPMHSPYDRRAKISFILIWI
jgi:hypothetical protein